MTEAQVDPSSPTQQPVEGLSPTLARNIDNIVEHRRRTAKAASAEDRFADAISAFAGSMIFVYIHLILFGGWILINVGVLPIIPAWDASLVVLAMVASVEAIFLSTFVLINQNRMAEQDDIRADLDLQVNLLNEHETTRLLKLVTAIARKVDVPVDDEEISELTRDVAPVEVLDRLAQRGDTSGHKPK